MENTNKCMVLLIDRGNRFSPYKLSEVRDDEMGRYNRQKSPENPATAIKDMIDTEEDATTHEERKRKDMKNNKNPRRKDSVSKHMSMKYVWNVMRSFKNARKLINWNSWQIKDREEKIVKTIEELSSPWVAEEYKRTEYQDRGQKIDEEFSKIELERALNVIRRNTTPGRDRIDYYMIKELPKEEFKEILLRIYNAVWKHGFIPRKWREYQVIFIDKIGKEKVRPICLCPLGWVK